MPLKIPEQDEFVTILKLDDARSRQRVKVLIVDDRPENLLALEAILDSPNLELIRANSGEEALRSLLQHDFAVILMDVQMPTMDGFETATLVRQRERSRHIPIIFLTAINRSETHIFKGYSLGAVDYIVKPIMPEILRSKISVFVELYEKNEAVKRQMELIRDMEKQRLEAEAARAREEFLRRERDREKEVAEALAKKAEELSRSNAELEQFAYVASHELQEPLRKVAGYTRLMARRFQGRLDKEADQFIENAVEEMERMRQLIDDLLTYARVGNRGSKSERVDSGAALDKALVHLAEQIEQSGASVTSEGLPVVTADSAQLTQLFHYLIGNAIKFRRQEPPLVHISAEQRETEWVFSVRDNGIGIEKEYADRIFGIFQRLHSRAEYPGTGIGLAVCKKIVERHGGRIWVESEPGKGSSFYFTFPG
jgi:signal transduction histidine kinase